jgi:hypothetical protein
LVGADDDVSPAVIVIKFWILCIVCFFGFSKDIVF